jgi:hypothetical protein
MRWKIIVVCAVITCIVSFAFFFKYTITEPSLLGMPYILWVSMLSTVIMVVLTYIGFRNFPFNEKK